MTVWLRFVTFVKDQANRQLYFFLVAKKLLMCDIIFSAFCNNTLEALKWQIGKKEQEYLQTTVDSGGGVYPTTGTYVRYSDTWDLPTWGRNNNKNTDSRTQTILFKFFGFGSMCGGHLWINVPLYSFMFCRFSWVWGLKQQISFTVSNIA